MHSSSNPIIIDDSEAMDAINNDSDDDSMDSYDYYLALAMMHVPIEGEKYDPYEEALKCWKREKSLDNQPPPPVQTNNTPPPSTTTMNNTPSHNLENIYGN